MRNALSLPAVGHATSLFFAISFVLCIAVSLIFPAHTMAQSLQQLLPGFEWLTARGFFIGLLEATYHSVGERAAPPENITRALRRCANSQRGKNGPGQNRRIRI